RSQSVNSAHVADARKPPSDRAWRGERAQRGSLAGRRGAPQAAQLRASSAASTARAIAGVESLLARAVWGGTLAPWATPAAPVVVAGVVDVAAPAPPGCVIVGA